MRVEPDDDQVSIVLVCAFNPRIFHPAWFAHKKMISGASADEAQLDFVLKEISQFNANYMSFHIQPNRFQVRCETIYKDLIRDLSLSTFQEHLPECPVWQLGINRTIAFSCGTQEIRDKLGDLLAPKEPWNRWGEDIKRSRNEKGHGGLTHLVMVQQPRPDGRDGRIQADVQPASNAAAVVVLNINNHFDIGKPDETIGAARAMTLLHDEWETSLEQAAFIADCLMQTVESIS